jgi:hypothetical protein
MLRSLNLFAKSASKRSSMPQAPRHFSSSKGVMSDLTVELGDEVFSTHNFDMPSTSVTTTKEELLGWVREMYTMRRMEITNDTEYKVGRCC